MESFSPSSKKRVDDCSSLLCVGLDPHIPDLASPTAASARDFCLNLVKGTAPYGPRHSNPIRPSSKSSAEGWTALRQVIEAVQEEFESTWLEIPVILDAKRGDIASTAEAMPNLHSRLSARIALR